MAKEKVKKPFYKKWWIWAIAVVVIFAFAQGGGDADSKADAPAASKPSAEPKASPEADAAAKEDAPVAEEAPEAEEPEAAAYKIGDKVTVGDMEYVINDKKVKSKVGPAIAPTEASGEFVIIDVTLKNNGNDAVTVDSSFFKLQQGEKTFEADSMASMSANQGNDGGIENSFFYEEVNPDSKITGKVAFDVSAKVASSKDLQLQVQTGIWGTETEVIGLN